MNEYKFEELSLEQQESFEYMVTEKKMSLFTELSGDNNPLHVAEQFAQHYGHDRGRVVYGMLTASLISTLGGMYLPGKYCLIQQVNIKFLAPVYIGDVLTVTGTIKNLYKSVKRAEILVEIKNHQMVKVVKAKLNVGFLE